MDSIKRTRLEDVRWYALQWDQHVTKLYLLSITSYRDIIV